MIYTFDLKDKVIGITGGYGYLGKAVVESLLFHGATVCVIGRNEMKYNDVFINTKNKHELFFVNGDVSNTESIKQAFEKINQQHGKIDILINNAFYSKGQSPETMSDEEWNYGIDGSLNSVFRCIREIIPYFKNQKHGKIINVSSMYGIIAPQFDVYHQFPQFLNPPHYGAAKAGIIQLTKYYASYLGQLGINVNAVSPGPFPSTNVQKEEGFVQELENKTCLNKIGKPEDLAGAFVFLSSDAANYITGQNIIIDGGWTTK